MINFNDFGFMNPGAVIYDIKYRRWSGRYDEDGGMASAGDYTTGTAICYVPRYRVEVETLIRECRDRKVAILVTDRNGTEYKLLNARLTYKFSTGDAANSSQGYELTFKGPVEKKYAPVLELTSTEIPPWLPGGEEGFVPGSDFGGDIEYLAGPQALTGECCIQVLTNPIAYTPTLTGNVALRNRIVTVASTSERWIIDKNGNAVQLSGGQNRKQSWTGPGSTFEVTNFDLATTLDVNLIVVRNGLILNPKATATDVAHYQRSGSNILVPSGYSLQSDELLLALKINDNFGWADT